MPTSDQTVLTEDEKNSIYGLSYPGGNAQINAIYNPRISTNLLYCDGDAYVYGCFRTRARMCNGATIMTGNVRDLSLTFGDDTNTGMYYDSGTINVVNSGQPTATFGPTSLNIQGTITTTSGNNLVLLPDGPYIDCSGRTLINVGGLPIPGPTPVVNPNRYEVVAPATLTTQDDLPTAIYNITTATNAAYTLVSEVTCAHTDSVASFAFTASVKNVAGNISISPLMDMNVSRDAALAGVACLYTISANNVCVTAKGLPATQIKWFGATVVTRQLF